MAENTKNLCAQIPESLHAKVRQAVRAAPEPVHDMAHHHIL